MDEARQNQFSQSRSNKDKHSQSVSLDSNCTAIDMTSGQPTCLTTHRQSSACPGNYADLIAVRIIEGSKSVKSAGTPAQQEELTQ